MAKRQLNYLQTYLVEEFVEDYNEGRMPRREMMARVLSVTGGVAATATLLLTLGCAPQPQQQPTAAPTQPPASAPNPTIAPAGTPVAGVQGPPAFIATRPPGPGTATDAAAQGPATSPTPAAAAKPAGTPAPLPTPMPARSKLSVPANDPDITASDVTFPGNGATILGYLAQPKGGGPFRAVLVCHENRGLVEHIRDVTRRLAKAGYVGLAVDLLSREGGTAKVDPAQVPGKLGSNPSQYVSDFQAGAMYLSEQTFVDKDKIGMTGFCFGGGITWLVITAKPDPMSMGTPALKAAVVFYGPPPPSDTIPNVNAAVLALYGGDDQRITSTEPAVEAAMKANNKVFEKIIYPGANHAFNNDTGANWNEAAATDAWTKTLAWFDKYLVASPQTPMPAAPKGKM